MDSAVSTPLVPTTHSLLRPDQVSEMVDEKKVLEDKLHSPRVEDKATVTDQLRRLTKQLETQRPRVFASDEIDRAVKREAVLRDEIGVGMLSQEEMRKCPPGAVDRHREWEQRNKSKILEWQNIQRRLNAENDSRESASIETFRPKGSTMNMDGALIPGRQFFNVENVNGPTVTFNDAEIALLRAQAPDIAIRLASYTNDQRAEVKRVVASFMEAPQEQAA